MKEIRTTQVVQRAMVTFFRENRRIPSFAEMVIIRGVRSKSVVNFWIKILIDANLLENNGKGHLTFTKRSFAIPLVGSIQAGFPSPEKEDLCYVISVDEYLIIRPEMSFILHVSGDCMTGA